MSDGHPSSAWTTPPPPAPTSKPRRGAGLRAVPWWGWVLIALVGLTGLGLLVGEPDPEERSLRTADIAPATSSATQRTTTSTPAPALATTRPTSPATTVSPPPPAAVSPGVFLPGYGMKKADWDRTHVPAGGKYTPGAAYGPLLRGGQPTYAGVYGDPVISYDVYMEPGTSLATAQARIGQEFPRDATFGRLVAGAGCHIQEVRSPTIEQLIGTGMIVAYSDDDPTIPADRRFRVATLITHTPGTTAEC